MVENEKILYDDGVHKEQADSYLSVNQYLIVQNGVGVLVDPGSEVIFDEMCEAVSKYVALEKIKFIFFSHQDPDVSGSIAQWAISTEAKFIMSALWVRFMSHYGFMEMSRVVALEDKGAKLGFGSEYLRFVPAHFMHSPGNFSLYDSKSKILFSGDIGAAIVQMQDDYKKVASFSEHVKHLEGFHKRYMASNRVCRAWVERVRALDVQKIAPQHGLVFEDEDVALFLEWLYTLECGSDLLENLF